MIRPSPPLSRRDALPRVCQYGFGNLSVYAGLQAARDIAAARLSGPPRRKTVDGIIDALNAVLTAEEDYRDGIPEQFTQRLETAGFACDQLSEAISLLEDAFR